jgi:hypothetical protein
VSGCGSFLQKILRRTSLGRALTALLGNRAALGVIPLPLPLKRLTGAGSAKSLCKILIADGLEVRILITKDFKACVVVSSSSAFALTMICFLELEHKVGGHRFEWNCC